MCGRLGFELHPKDLKPEEVKFAKRAVSDYKRIRPIVQQGDLYRLASPYKNSYSALMYTNADKSHAVLFVLGLEEKGERSASLKLAGLKSGVRYSFKEMNCASPRKASLDGLSFSTVLSGPYDSAVFEISSVK